MEGLFNGVGQTSGQSTQLLQAEAGQGGMEDHLPSSTRGGSSAMLFFS